MTIVLVGIKFYVVLYFFKTENWFYFSKDQIGSPITSNLKFKSKKLGSSREIIVYLSLYFLHMKG